MIELQTGKITFPELNITVSPLLHYADFISDFPKDKITQIRDMRNGYIWYDIKEKVYDNKIPDNALVLADKYSFHCFDLPFGTSITARSVFPCASVHILSL